MQAPAQPLKTVCGPGAAVRVTAVFLGKRDPHDAVERSFNGAR